MHVNVCFIYARNDLSPAKRNKKKRRPVREVRSEAPRGEDSRGVEAMTVLWMLIAVATLAAEVAAGAAVLLLQWFSTTSQGRSALDALPGVMLLTALFTGTLCLGLTLLVRRIRRVPPPTTVLWTAAAVGVSPWIILILASMLAER